MLRIVLFLLTNLAVMLVAGVVLSLLGVGSTHGAGNTLQLGNLLVMCFVFGTVGSLVSLLMSKWMAKRSMGVQMIESPRSGEERWLVDTVAELSQKAGIKMPEVGIFDSPQPNAFATGAFKKISSFQLCGNAQNIDRITLHKGVENRAIYLAVFVCIERCAGYNVRNIVYCFGTKHNSTEKSHFTFQILRWNLYSVFYSCFFHPIRKS